MEADEAVGRVHRDRHSLTGGEGGGSEQYWDNERAEYVNLSDLSAGSEESQSDESQPITDSSSDSIIEEDDALLIDDASSDSDSDSDSDLDAAEMSQALPAAAAATAATVALQGQQPKAQTEAQDTVDREAADRGVEEEEEEGEAMPATHHRLGGRRGDACGRATEAKRRRVIQSSSEEEEEEASSTGSRRAASASQQWKESSDEDETEIDGGQHDEEGRYSTLSLCREMGSGSEADYGSQSDDFVSSPERET